MWYNRFVKRFISAVVCAALTASVLCAAPGIKTKYADAQQGDVTAYPDFVSDLDTGDIDCYAANGNRFAFCRGEYIYIYSGGSMSDAPQDDGSGGTAYIFEGGIMENSSESGIYAYKHTSVITNIGYGEDGLLFTDATGTNYSYLDGEAKKEQELAPAAQQTSTYIGDSLFIYVAGDDSLVAIDMSLSEPVPYKPAPESAFSSLQKTSRGAYAIMDGGLCLIEQGEDEAVQVTPVLFRYTDTSHAEKIMTGDTAELLKTTRDARFAIAPAGQYVTEIDLSDISGRYFTVAEGGTFRLEESSPALILCTTGNADIIVMGESAYITASLGANISAVTSAAPFAGAQLNYAAGIYGSPYMCDATELIRLEPGAKVTVAYQIKAADQSAAPGALAADFCKVTYTSDKGTVTEGYIASSFLTAYDFSGEDGQFTPPSSPEDYTEDNAVLTVVLVIIIVVLVIAGVAYLAYSSGSGKHGKKQQTDDGERKE